MSSNFEDVMADLLDKDTNFQREKYLSIINQLKDEVNVQNKNIYELTNNLNDAKNKIKKRLFEDYTALLEKQSELFYEIKEAGLLEEYLEYLERRNKYVK